MSISRYIIKNLYAYNAQYRSYYFEDFEIIFFLNILWQQIKNCHLSDFVYVHIFFLRRFLVIAVLKICLLTENLDLFFYVKYAKKINSPYKIFHHYLANFLTNRMLSNITSFEGYEFIYTPIITWLTTLWNNFQQFNAYSTRLSSYYIKDFKIIFFFRIFLVE